MNNILVFPPPHCGLQLVSAVTNYQVPLLAHGVNLYKSLDMKIGLDRAKLQEHIGLLGDLIRLDARGGLFSQVDMETALAKLLGNARELGKPLGSDPAGDAEGLRLMAYKIRVMLSHVRITHDGASKTDKLHNLQPLFEVMTAADARGEVTHAKKLRRTERLQLRPHPFLAFRSSGDGGDISQDEDVDAVQEKARIVTKFYQPNDGVAVVLMDDGETINSDHFERGPNGFVQAVWIGTPNEYYETEFVNTCIDDEGTFTPAVKPVPAPKGKAKKKANGEGEEEGEGGKHEDSCEISCEEEGRNLCRARSSDYEKDSWRRGCR